jgi:hypothetical protein
MNHSLRATICDSNPIQVNAVTEPKQELDNKIGMMAAALAPRPLIARRLFLYDFPHVFTANQDRGFQILNTICEQFRLPFSAVKIVGSAQTGYSYFSHADFAPAASDLDVAIINAALFQEYSQAIYQMTDCYSNQAGFPRIDGISTAQRFRYYLGSGQFRPNLMPQCRLKADWFSFFSRLSNEHTDLFGNINAGIYLSEVFFEHKQASIVNEYRKGQP